MNPGKDLSERVTDHVRLRAAVYVEHQGKLLLVHDPIYRGGCWILPGGGAEFSETIVECAIRETQEETGIEVTVSELWRFREIWEPENKLAKENVFRKSLEMIFIGEFKGGRLRLPTAPGNQVVKDCRWIDVDLLGPNIEGVPVYPEELCSARRSEPLSGISIQSLSLPVLNLGGKP